MMLSSPRDLTLRVFDSIYFLLLVECIYGLYLDRSVLVFLIRAGNFRLLYFLRHSPPEWLGSGGAGQDTAPPPDSAMAGEEAPRPPRSARWPTVSTDAAPEINASAPRSNSSGGLRNELLPVMGSASGRWMYAFRKSVLVMLLHCMWYSDFYLFPWGGAPFEFQPLRAVVDENESTLLIGSTQGHPANQLGTLAVAHDARAVGALRTADAGAQPLGAASLHPQPLAVGTVTEGSDPDGLDPTTHSARRDADTAKVAAPPESQNVEGGSGRIDELRPPPADYVSWTSGYTTHFAALLVFFEKHISSASMWTFTAAHEPLRPGLLLWHDLFTTCLFYVALTLILATFPGASLASWGLVLSPRQTALRAASGLRDHG